MMAVGELAWAASLADVLDPPGEAAELADPVSLAVHCDKTYVTRAHLPIIGQAIAGLYRGDFDRLMVNTPPRVGKSTTAVEWAAFWWLVKNPRAAIVMASYGDDLALKRGRNVQRLVKRFGAPYGLTVERGHAAKKDWKVTAGGGVRSVGMTSGITGHDADVIFIDDPVRSRADANSLRKRDQASDWYSADLLSRLFPDGKVVLVATPWHEDDLRGRILAHEGNIDDGGTWKVIVMPAFATSEVDPLGRAIGEPLPHPRIAPGDEARLRKHWENKRDTSLPRDWIALYQCDPKPTEGTLLSYAILRERRCWQQGPAHQCAPRGRAAVAVDPSGGGRNTAGIIGGYLGEDGLLYILADKTDVLDPGQWARAACEMAVEIGADLIIFENNYGGEMGRLAIRTAWDALAREDSARFDPATPPLIRAVSARRNKTLRAEPVAQQWIEGRIWTATYLPELESEWALWTPGDVDSPGRIDASVYLALELLGVPTVESGEQGLAEMMASVDLFGGFGSRR